MASKSKIKRSNAKSPAGDRFKSFMRSPVGIWAGSVLFALLLLTLNTLIAGSSLEIFLGLTAFEIIVTTIVIWVILLRRRSK